MEEKEFTEEEKTLLRIIFKSAEALIQETGGGFIIDWPNAIDWHTLYQLREKLGIDDIVGED